MLTRLTHAAIAFAVTAVVYQVYVLAVVPFVEPAQLEASPNQTATEEQLAEARQVLHRHRELFAAYFPADHWTVKTPPKTFESGKAMIVLDDYQPKDNGQLRVNRCVILFFPQERVRGEPAPRDAIVLEAPHGAILQLDEQFRPGLGGIGKFQWGQLMGDILVRSDMRKPGPEDDLVLKTRNLRMDADMIRTDEQVDMQLGAHYGRGRQLEIRLIAVERAKSGSSGPAIGGIDTLKIMHDVEAQLAPQDAQLMTDFGNGATAKVPTKVTSQGPFTFDFTNQIAAFEKEVKLTQVHAGGLQDQLLCDQLRLYFAGEHDTVSPNTDRTININAIAAKQPGLGKLRPAMIEALGTAELPVRLDAPSQQAIARCQTIRMELDSRRITFNSNSEVILAYQGNEVHAPMLQYQAPAAGSPQRVGALLASGSGWIRGKADSKTNQEPYEARWTEKMRLSRTNGKPILTLEGRPRLKMIGLGQLWANYLQVHLRERAVDGSEDELLPGDVVPERMIARGSVAINSAEMQADVNKMDVRVDYVSNDLVLPTPNGNDPQTNRPAFGRPKGDRSRKYKVSGNHLEMQLTVRERRPEVSSIDVDGNVVLRESNPTDNRTQPLIVQGNHVRVINADSPSAEISLTGAPATITSADMAISASQLNVNRGEGRAWINAPGELRLPVKQGLGGNPLPGPQYLMVRWQQGMELKRDIITFQGQVVANTNEGSLQTNQLVLRLTAPVKFDGSAQQQQVELAQLECQQGVNAEFTQRDAQGLSSIQSMQLESIAVNQQTGNLQGFGPGWIESVHLSESVAGLGNFGQNNAPASNRMPQRLRFLRVDFKQGVRGNILAGRRRLELFGNTQAIYGPVDAWEQRLSTSVTQDPGPDTIVISGDKLIVAESPVVRPDPNAKMGPMEFTAQGNVVIDGSMGEHGLFNARAHTARYDQQKTMFVLEGDGRRPATLTRQEYVGAPWSETSLQKLIYIQSTGEVKGEGYTGGNFKQIDLGRQQSRPAQIKSR